MKIIKPDVQFITPIDGATILKRVNTLIFVLKYITRLAGFELLNRIEIKDRKTGREYK